MQRGKAGKQTIPITCYKCKEQGQVKGGSYWNKKLGDQKKKEEQEKEDIEQRPKLQK